MKLLSIKRGSLELARSYLSRPLVTIGRSPTCDVVLRLEGIAPVHFLLEWVGSGKFDPQAGQWSIFDISKSEDVSGEGVLLDQTPVEFKDLKFSLIMDKLENTEVLGGRVLKEYEANERSGEDLLELVQVRSDSGTIEQVLHLQPTELKKKNRPLRGVPQFKIEAPLDGKAIQILLEEMPGAQISRKGLKMQALGAVEVANHDLLEVHWNEYRFFIRWVDRLKVPVLERKFIQEPLLLKTSIFVLSLVLLLGFLTVYYSQVREPVPIQPPPRIATIEIKEVVPPPPAPPEVQKRVTEKPLIPKNKVETKAKPKAAIQRHPPKVLTQQKKIGLNSPAKVTNVNSIGFLGALRKTTNTGKGVKADHIINEAVLTESISGQETDHSKVVVKNPPAGVLGTETGGDDGKNKGEKLSEASTTLRASGKYDSKSVGPIAEEGGSATSFAPAGGGKDLNATDVSFKIGDETSVMGGLDRESVRRVIMANRSTIRNCYESALLSNRKLSGRVVYKWQITATGPVLSVDHLRSDTKSSVLDACVSSVIKKMVFPKSPNGQPTVVIYPFVFQSNQ